MAIRLAVLTLFCAFAIGEGGVPRNFEASLSNSYNDDTVVDVELKWDKVECGFGRTATYTITYTQNGAKQEVSTKYSERVIQWVEFWTTYNFTLSTECYSHEGDISISIQTGPGNPHRVAAVYASPNGTEAEVVWSVASILPRIPDMYNVTYCVKNTDECNFNLVGNNNSSWLRTVLHDLYPLTSYTVNVSAVIFYQGKYYTGPAVMTDFYTTEFAPQPKNFKVVFSSGKAGHNATITWELNTKLRLQYNISLVETYNRTTTIATATTNKTTIEFSKLSFNSNLTVQVLPILTYNNKQYNGHLTNFSFRVPGGDTGPVGSAIVSNITSNSARLLMKTNHTAIVVNFVDLEPKTSYTFNVNALLKTNTKANENVAVSTNFTTKAIVFPVPKNFGLFFSQGYDGVDANITWKLETTLPLLQYNISLINSDNKLLQIATTKESNIKFTGLTSHSNLTLFALPIFNFHNNQHHGDSAYFRFSVPRK